MILVIFMLLKKFMMASLKKNDIKWTKRFGREQTSTMMQSPVLWAPSESCCHPSEKLAHLLFFDKLSSKYEQNCKCLPE